MEARELRQDARQGRAAAPIADAHDRERVELQGTPARRSRCGRAAACPRSRPSCTTAPALITLVWLGRRRIAGIVARAGRSRSRAGSACTDDDRVIYNPRYELRP